MKEEEVVERIRTRYPDATIDIAGEDCSFELYIVSEAFAGQGLLQRQKDVLALFKDDIGSGALHALSIKAKTRAEMEAQPGLIQIGL